jgi:diaminopimelate epimerase
LGIGADGILFVGPSKNADVFMRIINSDGSEAEMCGNGLRAVLDYVDSKSLKIETLGGIYTGAIDKKLGPNVAISCEGDTKKLELGDKFETGYYLTCGVPHVVIQVNNLEALDIMLAVPIREKFNSNVNFFEVIGSNEICIRTYERGVGETLSCGSGACSVGVVLRDILKMSGNIKTSVKGGDFNLKLDKKIYLCGKADKIFEGRICLL